MTNNNYARMATFNVNYRDDYKSFTIDAFDTEGYNYFFTTHALKNAWNRSTNLKTMQDFQLPVRRIIRCISTTKIRNWLKTRPFGTQVVIHDTDIHMAYVVGKRHLQYHIITIFNEFLVQFNNSENSQEVWFSESTGKWRFRDMKAGMVGKYAIAASPSTSGSNNSSDSRFHEEIRRKLREDESKQHIRSRMTEIDNRVSRLSTLIQCTGFSDEERNGFTEMVKEFQSERAILEIKLMNGGKR